MLPLPNLSPHSPPANLPAKLNSWLSWKKLLLFALMLAAINYFTYAKFIKNPLADITTTPAKLSSIQKQLEISGQVKARHQVALTFQTSGRLAWLGVAQGDTVTKGQALAKLDTTILNADFQRARSDLRNAQAALERVHDDIKNHDKDETFTQKETRTAAEVAKDKAWEAVIKAEKNLQNATLIAPANGIVTSITPKIAGANITPNTFSLTIADPQSVIFVAEVDETDIGQLSLGQPATITLDSYPNEKITSQVEKIAFASVTTASGGTAFEAELPLPPNRHQKFRLGMSGDTAILVEKKSTALTIPLDALREDNQQLYVYLQTPQGFKKKLVETGIENDTHIEIISGLTAGDLVVTAGFNHLETP